MTVKVTLTFSDAEWLQLQKDAKFKSKREDEDFMPSDYYGMHADDCFDGGWDDGYDTALSEVAQGLLDEAEVEFI